MISAFGMSALAAGATVESVWEADQSVPVHRRSDGIGISLGSGTGSPGIDGMFSGGGAIRLDRPVAASGVNGLDGAGTPTLATPDAPGTGAGGGGSAETIEFAPSCTVRITPGGVRRSSMATELPGVPGMGSPGVPEVPRVEAGGVDG